MRLDPGIQCSPTLTAVQTAARNRGRPLRGYLEAAIFLDSSIKWRHRKAIILIQMGMIALESMNSLIDASKSQRSALKLTTAHLSTGRNLHRIILVS